MITVAFCNQKGGVGKTTTAVNLAAYLANLGKKILFIDFDAQANASSVFLKNLDSQNNIYQAILDLINPEEILRKTNIENLDILPSHQDLAGASVELLKLPRWEFKLKDIILKLNKYYDYVFIDCPPSLGVLTINALVASDKALIPLQCEYYALEGLSDLIKTIDLIKENLNKNLSILGVLPTMFNKRSRLANDVLEEIRENFSGYNFKTIIPRNVSLAEAPSFSKTILEYAPNSKGARAYEELAKEFLKILEDMKEDLKNKDYLEDLDKNKNNDLIKELIGEILLLPEIDKKEKKIK